MLTQIADKLEEEVNKFNATQKAIGLKEKELQELYEIEKSAMTLAALIETQNQKRQQFETGDGCPQGGIEPGNSNPAGGVGKRERGSTKRRLKKETLPRRSGGTGRRKSSNIPSNGNSRSPKINLRTKKRNWRKRFN